MMKEFDVSQNSATFAAAYYAKYPNHPPDYFLASPSKIAYRVNQALGDGEGWACRLISLLDEPHFFTLHTSHLDLPHDLGDARGFYKREVVRAWLERLRSSFKPPFWCRIELGQRVHAHLIADAYSGLPDLRRNGEVAKQVYDEKRLLHYLYKPLAFYTAENLALWLDARKKGRIVRHSYTHGLPNKSTWLRADRDLKDGYN